MIGHCYGCHDISDALLYGRNALKGGEILMANLTDICASPEQQARDWEAMSNNYKVNCYCIVVSFSDNETRMLRSMPDSGRDKVMTIMRDFVAALEEKGNNITGCPFLAVRHNNTDNEHYHLYVLTTTMQGRKMNDSFIKKNTSRAASKVALAYGLEGAEKSMANERAHQEASGRRSKEERQRVHRPSTSQEEIDEKLRRKRAADEARKRRQRLKFIIEKAAKESSAKQFKAALAEEGLKLYKDKHKGLCVQMDDNGKVRKYSLAKDLLVDMALLPSMDPPKKSEVCQRSVPSPQRLAPQASPSAKTGMGKIGTGNGCGSGVNREFEIDRGRNPDDEDERMRRKGYHL